jgi:hypothetical protein
MVSRWLLTIDNFCQNTGTSRFSNASWATKQKSMSQMIAAQRIFQSKGNMLLSNDICKQSWSILPRRYHKITHNFLFLRGKNKQIIDAAQIGFYSDLSKCIFVLK